MTGCSTRWPSNDVCYGHGTCYNTTLLLENYLTSHPSNSSLSSVSSLVFPSCRCDAGWGSSGDFLSAPSESCHVSFIGINVLWYIALAVISLCSVKYIKTTAAYCRKINIQTVRKQFEKENGMNGSRIGSTRSISEADRSSSLHLCQFLCASQHFRTIRWYSYFILNNPTRRTLFCLFFFCFFFFVLSIVKIICISLDITMNIGVNSLPTILYCLGGISFLISGHCSR